MRIEIQRNEENFKLPKKIEDKGQKKKFKTTKAKKIFSYFLYKLIFFCSLFLFLVNNNSFCISTNNCYNKRYARGSGFVFDRECGHKSFVFFPLIRLRRFEAGVDKKHAHNNR